MRRNFLNSFSIICRKEEAENEKVSLISLIVIDFAASSVKAILSQYCSRRSGFSAEISDMESRYVAGMFEKDALYAKTSWLNENRKLKIED